MKAALGRLLFARPGHWLLARAEPGKLRRGRPVHNVSEKSISQLESQIGYQFRNRKILGQAITHGSVANSGMRVRLPPGKTEGTFPSAKSNERLELLGDGILGALMLRMLFWQFPSADEGELSRRRDNAVSTNSLNKLVHELDISRFFIRVGKIEGNLNTARVHANFLEALLAAIYLDGGFSAAEKFFADRIQPLITDRLDPLVDYKALLRRHKPEVSFTITEETDDFGDTSFVARARWQDGKLLAFGRGPTKRQAQAVAAQIGCEKLSLKLPYVNDTVSVPAPDVETTSLTSSVDLTDVVNWSDDFRRSQDALLRDRFRSLEESFNKELPDDIRNELYTFIQRKVGSDLRLGFEDASIFETGSIRFHSACWVGSFPLGVGRGTTKKQARKVAAAQAFHRIRRAVVVESGFDNEENSTSEHPAPKSKNILTNTLQEMRSRSMSPMSGLVQAQLSGLPSQIVPKRFGGGGIDFPTAVQIIRQVAHKGCLSCANVLAAHFATIGAAVSDRTHDSNVWNDVCWDLILQSGLVGTERLKEKNSVTLEAKEVILKSGRVMWRLNGSIECVSGAHVVDFLWCFARTSEGKKVLVILPRSDGISVRDERSLGCCDVEVCNVMVGNDSVFETSGLERRSQWGYGCLSAAVLGALDQILSEATNEDNEKLQRQLWAVESLLRDCTEHDFDGVAYPEITAKLRAVLEMAWELLNDCASLPQVGKTGTRLKNVLASYKDWSF